MDALRNAIARDTEAIVGSLAQPRFAVVESVDTKTHSVRLRLQPEDVVTGWVPDASAFATGSGFGVVCPLAPGDQVIALHAHGDADHPVVIGRLFSTVDMPPISPATGKAVGSREFAVFCDGAFLHIAGGIVHAKAATFKLQGDLELDGKITTTGDVTAGTVSVQQHVHTKVQPGGSLSGVPKT